MKKFFLFFLSAFLLFSCGKSDFPTEKFSYEEHQNCLMNAPFRENSYSKMYWSFKNFSDQKCWHFGYINDNFFLTNGEDFEVLYATGADLTETESKKGDWGHFDGTYGNLLWKKFGGYPELTADVNENFWYSWHEMPNFANFYDILKLFAFAKNFYELDLPENPAFFEENFSENDYCVGFILEKSKNPAVGEYNGREYFDHENAVYSPVKCPDFPVSELYEKVKNLPN